MGFVHTTVLFTVPCNTRFPFDCRVPTAPDAGLMDRVKVMTN